MDAQYLQLFKTGTRVAAFCNNVNHIGNLANHADLVDASWKVERACFELRGASLSYDTDPVASSI